MNGCFDILGRMGCVRRRLFKTVDDVGCLSGYDHCRLPARALDVLVSHQVEPDFPLGVCLDGHHFPVLLCCWEAEVTPKKTYGNIAIRICLSRRILIDFKKPHGVLV